MSKRPGRNHVHRRSRVDRVNALNGEQMCIKLLEGYQIHPKQIRNWNKQLLEHAENVFSKGKRLMRFQPSRIYI